MISFQASLSVSSDGSHDVRWWRNALLGAGRLLVENARQTVLVTVDDRFVSSV